MRYVLMLLLHGPFFVTSSRDWCEEKCGDLKHLRCVAWLHESNQKCSKIEVGFSPKERMSILDAHNRWRDYVASGLGRNDSATTDFMVFNPYEQDLLPGTPNLYNTQLFLWQDDDGQAADMRQLVWDYDLEKNAAIWASQCNSNVTRPYHCAFTEKFSMVHMNTDPSNNAFPLTGGFVSFLKFINYPDIYFKGDRVKLIRSYRSSIWDPFYALIYSQTYAIGCSRALCDCVRDQYPFGYKKCGSVTCLYGPTFDKTTSKYKIYEVDKVRCSRCPSGTACRADARYKYLCARPDDPKDPEPIPDGINSTFPKHLPSSTNLCLALFMLLVKF